jgi:hypothetical protein
LRYDRAKRKRGKFANLPLKPGIKADYAAGPKVQLTGANAQAICGVYLPERAADSKGAGIA